MKRNPPIAARRAEIQHRGVVAYRCGHCLREANPFEDGTQEHIWFEQGYLMEFRLHSEVLNG